MGLLPKKKGRCNNRKKWSYQDHYKYWVKSSRLTSFEKKKLESLSEQEKKELFSVTGEEFQFGTSGIREIMGIGPKRLNIHTCRVFAEAYAKFIHSWDKKISRPIFVGFDNRENSRLFAATICHVLNNFQIPVIFSNVSIPTPVLAYLIRKKNFSGGVMVTASHNPVEYNGFKLYGNNGGQLSDEEEKIIRSFFTSPNHYLSTLKKGINRKIAIIDESWWNLYIKDLQLQIVRKLGGFYTEANITIRNLKILFSSHHGTSSKRMRYLAHFLGLHYFKEYYWECIPDIPFPKKEILNPENPLSFKEMELEGRTSKMDYLFAHDPDSDRGAFGESIGNDWYYFTGNEMFALLASFLLELAKSPKYNVRFNYKYLITTYVSGNFIDKVVKLFDNSIEIKRVKTGFKSIGKEVEKCSKEGDVLLGCEEAIGGLFFPSLSLEKDAFQLTALAFFMIGHYRLRKSKTLLTQLLWLMWETKSVWLNKTISVVIKKEDKSKILEKLKEITDNKEFVLQLDQYKFSISRDLNLNIFTFSIDDENWIKVRISGTEEKLKLYFNFYSYISDEEFNTKINVWESLIKEKRSKINYKISLLTKAFINFLSK